MHTNENRNFQGRCCFAVMTILLPLQPLMQLVNSWFRTGNNDERFATKYWEKKQKGKVRVKRKHYWWSEIENGRDDVSGGLSAILGGRIIRKGGEVTY